MKILISIILFLLISCDSENSQITPQYYIDSINIENTTNSDIFILANDWFIVKDTNIKNRDQENMWSTDFVSNKLYFSKNEYHFKKTKIYGNEFISILDKVPLLYRVKPKGIFNIKLKVNNKLIDNKINYLNYHIYYFDDISILNKLSEYNMRNTDSLSINFDSNLLRLSKCLDTINFEDKKFLETSKHLDIIGSRLIH